MNPYARYDICCTAMLFSLTKQGDMTHQYEWRDSFMKVTWPMHHRLAPITKHGGMTQEDMRHDAFMRATWLIPHQKLLGDGLSTPITPFSLICTISSELSVILDSYQNSPRS